MPFVRDAISVATPHGGSFLRGNRFGRFAASLFQAPQNLVDVSVDFARAGIGAGTDAVGASIEAIRGDEDAKVRREIARIPGSVENMREDSPFIQTLRSIPIDPGVRTH